MGSQGIPSEAFGQEVWLLACSQQNKVIKEKVELHSVTVRIRQVRLQGANKGFPLIGGSPLLSYIAVPYRWPVEQGQLSWNLKGQSEPKLERHSYQKKDIV